MLTAERRGLARRALWDMLLQLVQAGKDRRAPQDHEHSFAAGQLGRTLYALVSLDKLKHVPRAPAPAREFPGYPQIPSAKLAPLRAGTR